MCFLLGVSICKIKINRIYDRVEAETRKSQASIQIIYSYARLAENKTYII